MIDLSRLPPVHVQRGTDPAFVREELDFAIDRAIADHPRSRQRAIGPSEVGHPCARRLAYRLAGAEEVNTSAPRWKPTVGTAVHAWLDKALEKENTATGAHRWLTEVLVEVGTVAGQPIRGRCDCYDRTCCGAIDFKIMGVTSLRNLKANGPGPQYRAQIHLYARGLETAGFPVDWVGIYALPQNGERHEAVWWTEPYSEQVATGALDRLSGIATLTGAAGPAAAALLPATAAFCPFCPFYSPASTELWQACPGFDHASAATAAA